MSTSKVKDEGHRGQKKKKSAAFCSGAVLEGSVLLRRWENQRMLSSYWWIFQDYSQSFKYWL